MGRVYGPDFFFCVLNFLLEGNLSQCSYLGPSFYLMINSGNFWSFFSLQISTFHKIKTRHLIRMLRHFSLHLYLINTCVKFENISVSS